MSHFSQTIAPLKRLDSQRLLNKLKRDVWRTPLTANNLFDDHMWWFAPTKKRPPSTRFTSLHMLFCLLTLLYRSRAINWHIWRRASFISKREELSLWNNPWHDHNPHCQIYYFTWTLWIFISGCRILAAIIRVSQRSNQHFTCMFSMLDMNVQLAYFSCISSNAREWRDQAHYHTFPHSIPLEGYICKMWALNIHHVSPIW